MMAVTALLAAIALAGCTKHTARTTLRGGLIGGGIGLVAGALYGAPLEGAARGAALGAAGGAIVGTIDELSDGRRVNDREYRSDVFRHGHRRSAQYRSGDHRYDRNRYRYHY